MEQAVFMRGGAGSDDDDDDDDDGSGAGGRQIPSRYPGRLDMSLESVNGPGPVMTSIRQYLMSDKQM
ncbi:unnamed protein product [Alternaria alternata]